ncbi:MAG: hypothetical protein AUG49_13445 [Catenulispora sp. 13_1_20CM_3_70_7]|nr:hypothetical protein [Catenulisporales bacterium]OLE24393.1 MAG: hypothetical protein AUG49_13445 [Catenulispora sp. 13_1_20CM_3_70_7]
MRVIPWSGSPDAVARVDRRGEVFVAVPRGLAPGEVLDLASLVLSASEFEEFAAILRRDERSEALPSHPCSS